MRELWRVGHAIFFHRVLSLVDIDHLAEVEHGLRRRAGITVFFDQHSIPPGADWERHIRTVVRDCGLFLPIVSRHAAERDEGWFLKEWGLAIERAQGIKAHVPFIQPILIDDLPERDPRIPEYFWTRQCQRFPGGVPAPGFVAGIQSTLREIQLRKPGLSESL